MNLVMWRTTAHSFSVTGWGWLAFVMLTAAIADSRRK